MKGICQREHLCDQKWTTPKKEKHTGTRLMSGKGTRGKENVEYHDNNNNWSSNNKLSVVRAFSC